MLKICRSGSSAIIGLILVFALTCRSIASECDAILQSGVRNTFQILQTGNFDQSFRNAYCTGQLTSTTSSSGGQIGGSYAGFGLNYGQNGSQAALVKKQFCQNTSSASSSNQYLSALQSVADPNIVAAWTACVNNGYGLYINGDLYGDILNLTFKFRAAGAINQTVVEYNDPYIVGAACQPIVKKGTIINTGGMVEACRRAGAGPVSVTVNSSFGPATLYVPPLQPRLQQPSPSNMRICRINQSDGYFEAPESSMAAQLNQFGINSVNLSPIERCATGAQYHAGVSVTLGCHRSRPSDMGHYSQAPVCTIAGNSHNCDDPQNNPASLPQPNCGWQ